MAEKISSFIRKIEYLASVDELMPIAFDILKYTDECVYPRLYHKIETLMTRLQNLKIDTDKNKQNLADYLFMYFNDKSYIDDSFAGDEGFSRTR